METVVSVTRHDGVPPQVILQQKGDPQKGDDGRGVSFIPVGRLDIVIGLPKKLVIVMGVSSSSWGYLQMENDGQSLWKDGWWLGVPRHDELRTPPWIYPMDITPSSNDMFFFGTAMTMENPSKNIQNIIPYYPTSTHIHPYYPNWLVVWLPFLAFSQKYWVANHPNWRTHIFQRGSNHQPVS